MSELMTSLAVLAYGTAAVVGVQLIASGLSRLSGLAVRRNGNPNHPDQRLLPQAVAADLVLLAAGLFLLLQGVVVVAWTFA
ncbi:hypothetical protein LCGC14_1583400 [marine sediment metagenome]|uniref:Uncharacterized protein n=1 Tax=marine sediment metagenome TaxID=412755 RepID=A0A0F9IG79_9ZZZZ